MEVGRESKYAPLNQYLRERNERQVTLTLAAIETLLDDPLPPSARHRRGWWSNRRRGSVQASAWISAGYHVTEIDLGAGVIAFTRPESIYRVRRIGGRLMWDGRLVRGLRRHMGLSQADFANELGVRQQTVSEWERGVYAPRRASSRHLELVAERAGFTFGEVT